MTGSYDQTKTVKIDQCYSSKCRNTESRSIEKNDGKATM